jgi:hypothetical protein
VSVTLRDPSPSDEAWLDTWLPAAATSVTYDLPTDNKHERAIIERDGVPAGIVIWRRRTRPRNAAIIELIATPPEQARCGSGMQAAALLEAQLRADGTRTLFAPASAVHGIAMYFWIRLGYRPLLRPEWPCGCEGVAWLRRDLG